MTNNTTSTQPTQQPLRGTLVSDTDGVQTITTPDGQYILLTGLARNNFAKVGDSGDVLYVHTPSALWQTFRTDLEALASDFLSQPGGELIPPEQYHVWQGIVREAFDMGRMFEARNQLRTAQSVLNGLDQAIDSLQAALQD